MGGLAILPVAACSDRPEPVPPRQIEKAAKAGVDLVELTKLDPSIRLDIRYATAANLAGRTLYRQARAFLVWPAAKALIRAHRNAQAEGCGLTIFDAYRPWRVTKALWDATPPGPRRNYVANPKRGSKHNRGCAVDLSLHDLATGQLLAMPSDYDDLSPRAHRDFMDASADAIANRAALQRLLEVEGFKGLPHEWWHFDFAGWEAHPILDVPFEAL